MVISHMSGGAPNRNGTLLVPMPAVTIKVFPRSLNQAAEISCPVLGACCDRPDQRQDGLTAVRVACEHQRYGFDVCELVRRVCDQDLHSLEMVQLPQRPIIAGAEPAEGDRAYLGHIIVKEVHADRTQGVFHRSCVASVMISRDRIDPERRFQPAKRLDRQFNRIMLRCKRAAAEQVSREHHDVGMKRIGLIHDPRKSIGRSFRAFDMRVGHQQDPDRQSVAALVEGSLEGGGADDRIARRLAVAAPDHDRQYRYHANQDPHFRIGDRQQP